MKLIYISLVNYHYYPQQTHEMNRKFHSCFWTVSADCVKQRRSRVCQGTLPSVWALNLLDLKCMKKRRGWMGNVRVSGIRVWA